MTDNPYTRSTLHEFLKEEGLYEECHASALKRVLARRIEEAMKQRELAELLTPEEYEYEPVQLRPAS